MSVCATAQACIERKAHITVSGVVSDVVSVEAKCWKAQWKKVCIAKKDIWHLLDKLYTKSEGNSCGSQDSIIIIII